MRRFVQCLAMSAALCSCAVVGSAWARNFHISGGIQYVAQGDKEKAKGLYEDAHRLYGKAVAQLVEGLAEDEDDVEAWDYLGRAYAELDSAERAGQAFGTGIGMACADETKKKLCKRMQDNRKFYWAAYYQSSLDTYKLSDAAAPEAQGDSVLAAAAKMNKAIAVWAEEPSSYCNLAAFYAKVEQYEKAMEIVERGQQVAPGDSCLISRKEGLVLAGASKAAASGEYDTAIAAYEKILAGNPNDATTANQLGELYFKKAQKLEKDGDAAGAKTAYAGAAKNFGRYFELTPDDPDARYNYALMLNQAGDYAAAAGVIHKGLMEQPDSNELHSLMAASYAGMKLDDDATKHRLVAMVVREGQKAEDPAGFATASAQKWGAKSAAAQELQKMGPPEAVYTQQRGDYDVELWCWWAKSRTLTLVKGGIVSDLSFAQVATAAKN